MKILKEINEDKFYATDVDFEEIPLADTYDMWGQRIGAEAAQDYSLQNAASYAREEFIQELRNNKYKDSEINFDGDYVEVDGTLYDWRKKEGEIGELANKWEEENANQTMCLAHTYWDGHNWKTIVIESDTDDAITHLVQDLEFSEVEKDDNYEIVKSNLPWASYEITKK